VCIERSTQSFDPEVPVLDLAAEDLSRRAAPPKNLPTGHPNDGSVGATLLAPGVASSAAQHRGFA